MAFSYSDKNFTVIGNLCFVHILLDGTQGFYDIPSAISDRMLSDSIGIYPYIAKNNVRGGSVGSVTKNIGFVTASNGKIVCSEPGTGYLYFYFPIDSNK